MRWGTFTLGDLEVATRLMGPTVAAGTVVVRGGMIVAFVAALVGESQIGGFRARTWGERAASAVAAAALVLLFIAPGPSEAIGPSIAWRVPAAAAASAAILVLQPLVRKVPPAVATALAITGIFVALIAS